MGFWNQLGSVINSYFNDFAEETKGRFRSSGDPDFDAAYEELDDYLNQKNSGKDRSGHSWKDAEQENRRSSTGAYSAEAKLPPKELKADFGWLGVPFGADYETCKAAYKKLLKIHHPDHHAGHEGNFKKATEMSAIINAAWDRIEKYYRNEGI